MGESPRESPEQAVSRWEVYGKISLRAMITAVAGGATIGLVTVAAFEPRFTPWGVLVGIVYGVILGLTAGPVVSGLLVALVVPYRGARWTRLMAATTATASVAAFFAIAFGEPTQLDSLELTGAIAGVGGAALCSPYLVHWYIRRAEHGSEVRSKETVS